MESAYGRGTVYGTGSAEITKIDVDDKGPTDRYGGFCTVKVVLSQCDGGEFRVELLHAPCDSRVEGLVEELGGEWEETPLGRMLTLNLSVTRVSDIRTLAKAIRQVVGRGRRYDDRNWKWICPRTAASLDRFADTIMDYRRSRQADLAVR
jgi:hypothetical protein